MYSRTLSTLFLFSYFLLLSNPSQVLAAEVSHECAVGNPGIVDGDEVCCLEQDSGNSLCCTEINADGDGCAGDEEDECEAGETSTDSGYVVTPATCSGDSCDGDGTSIDYNSQVEYFREEFVCGDSGKFEHKCWSAGLITYECGSTDVECPAEGPRGEDESFDVDGPKIRKVKEVNDPFSNC